MIINVKQLLDFKSGHGDIADLAIMSSICSLFELRPTEVTKGFYPGYDFVIENTKIELKTSSKGLDGLIEIARADGRASGLSVTEADVYAFLNPAGNGKAKLRLIHTFELKRYIEKYSGDDVIETKTVGDRIGDSSLIHVHVKLITVVD